MGLARPRLVAVFACATALPPLPLLAGGGEDTIDVCEQEPTNSDGDWHVQARFDGDAEHAGSVASECTVPVFNSGS